MLAVDGPTPSQGEARPQGSRQEGRQDASASAHGNAASCGVSQTHTTQDGHGGNVDDLLRSRARRILACLDRATASGAAAVGGSGAGECAVLGVVVGA